MRIAFNRAAIICTLLSLFTLSGCYYDKEDLLYPPAGSTDCTTIPAKFSVDIKSIMENKCATSGCHDASTGAGSVTLVTYAQISAAAVRINQRCVIDKTMPPGAPLTTAEINALKCWINSGAPNN
ncbi:MAG: hypothetical protein JST02_07560 [Bacteroidetes bacterium]|nr:hypothetical protein [Bacteroidota bacterium]